MMLAFPLFAFLLLLLPPVLQVDLAFTTHHTMLTVDQQQSDALWQVVARNDTLETGCNLGNTTRVLVTIPSFGTKQRSLLLKVLRGMEGIALHVFQLDIVLLLTVPLNYSTPHPHKMHVRMELFPPSIGHHLVSQFRSFMVSSLLGSLHDLYVIMEDDMALRLHHLQALCAEVDFLRGTKYFPGFLRYETVIEHDAGHPPQDPSSIFLSDHFYRSTPRIRSVFRLAGREFVLPQRAYQAMVVLPAAHLYQALLRMGRNVTFHFLNGSSTVREYYTTFWVHNQYLVKVVPLDKLRRFLIHHMSNKYMLAAKEVLAKEGITSPAVMKKKLKAKPHALLKLLIPPLLSEFLAAVQACNSTNIPATLPPPNPHQYFAKLPPG
eukprot:GGOE01006611.1.p1 GENE.GGOE01006611.1~~GGOE01006611.1.p1  ORF type:complete len:378 (+),score=81.80 GGOE01006611.1:83-1216(+)